MTRRKFEGYTPRIADNAFVDPSAVIIGNVEIGEDSSIWPMVVIRGDIHQIRIGARCSIQDGTIAHVTHAGEYNPGGFALTVCDEVTVGHRCILHGCAIENRVLIGMGSTIMDGAILHSTLILGANSLVPPGKELESGYLWLGSPVKRIRKLREDEFAYLQYTAQYYVELKNRYLRDGLQGRHPPESGDPE